MVNKLSLMRQTPWRCRWIYAHKNALCN